MQLHILVDRSKMQSGTAKANTAMTELKKVLHESYDL